MNEEYVKKYDIDNLGNILNPDNKFAVAYDNGRDITGNELDELSISTSAGVCWLHLECMDTLEDGRQVFCLNIADQLVYVHVPTNGKAWLNDRLEAREAQSEATK
jgi:hypothetical protein